MQKTALVDVDGVLADFVTPIIRFANQHAAAEAKAAGDPAPKPIRRDDLTRFFFFDMWPKTTVEGIYDVLAMSNFWALQTQIDGAVKGIEELRRLGYEVIACSSPWVRCPQWEHTRRAWLKDHFDIKADDFISARAKHHVTGHTLIDDHPENVCAWAQAHPGRPILFASPWNRDTESEDIDIAHGWGDVVEILAR